MGCKISKGNTGVKGLFCMSLSDDSPNRRGVNAFYRMEILNTTLFPRIMVHALKYETEAMVHAPNERPI